MYLFSSGALNTSKLISLFDRRESMTIQGDIRYHSQLFLYSFILQACTCWAKVGFQNTQADVSRQS